MLVISGYYVNAHGYYVELATRLDSVQQGSEWGIEESCTLPCSVRRVYLNGLHGISLECMTIASPVTR